MNQYLLALVFAATFAFGAQNTSETSSPIRQENQDGFTVIGITARTNDAPEAGRDDQIKQLWVRVAHGALASVPERADDNIVAVYSGYAGSGHGEHEYTLGVRVKDGTIPPAGFVARSVAPGRYAVMLSDKGLPPEVVLALWRKISGFTLTELGGDRGYTTDFEVYPAHPGEDETTVAIHIGLKP